MKKAVRIAESKGEDSMLKPIYSKYLPHNISFTNLKYEIRNQSRPCWKNSQNTTTKEILKGLTGYCRFGQVTAIMGSSGSGKTTLLNFLCGRLGCTNGKSQVMVNGKEYTQSQFSSFGAYVMQNDALLQTFTPKEAFTFAADLKYKDSHDKATKVAETIELLQLDEKQDVPIGNVFLSFRQGLSGGERKLTSIGYELIGNPTVLILDEPTSGLDSFKAYLIVDHLSYLAKDEGRTIIFSIHQPSQDICDLFDRIMLIVKGEFIYQGEYKYMQAYFRDIGYRVCDNQSPMDYFMSLMHKAKTDSELLSNFTKEYLIRVNPEIEEQMSRLKGEEIDFKPDRIMSVSSNHKIYYITRRAMLYFFKDKFQLIIRLFQSISVGLLAGSVFYQVTDNDGQLVDMFSVSGALFFICISYLFSYVMQVVISFQSERIVYLREENANMYTPIQYYIGKQFVEIPFCIILPIVQELISYWMIGFNDTQDHSIITHIGFIILLCFSSNSLGLMAGCLFSDIQQSINIVPIILMPMFIFSGFLANTRNQGWWINWISYLSPIRYVFEGLSIKEYNGRVYISDPIEYYQFDIGTYGCFLVLIAFAILFRLLGLWSICRISTKLQ